MSYLREFIVIFLTAAVFQNAVFTRGLGLSKHTTEMSSLRASVMFGGTLTLLIVSCALVAWPLNRLIRENNLAARFGFRYLASLSAMLCIAVILVLLYFLSRAYFPRYHYALRPIMPHITLNCAVLGTILLSFADGRSLFQTVSFALGSGLGYTVALMLMCEGRRRIMLSDVPRSFRGFPVMLLYIGIFSMAIYGLIGHQIPT